MYTARGNTKHLHKIPKYQDVTSGIQLNSIIGIQLILVLLVLLVLLVFRNTVELNSWYSINIGIIGIIGIILINLHELISLVYC